MEKEKARKEAEERQRKEEEELRKKYEAIHCKKLGVPRNLVVRVCN